MKNTVILTMMITLAAGMNACKTKPRAEEKFNWVVDRFDDIKVLRYQVPGFDTLSLEEKKLIYYLNQAALCGRDIFFDQNGRYNLRIRRTLEAIEQGYTGDRTSEDFGKFEKYLKKVWFANGIHHHYSLDKFLPEFSESYFDELVAGTPAEIFSAGLHTVRCGRRGRDQAGDVRPGALPQTDEPGCRRGYDRHLGQQLLRRRDATKRWKPIMAN